MTYYTYTNYDFIWSNWPEYNQSEKNVYDMSATTKYLELKVPGYKQNNNN